MKYLTLSKKNAYMAFIGLFALAFTISLTSCDFEYELPEANSKEDITPPDASFSASEDGANFLIWRFGNASTNANMYAWDFGDGNTSTSVDGVNTYAAEGTYTVTLTASDALGKSDTFSKEITVVKPAVADPVLQNSDFDKTTKLGGSDCSCSGWDNDDIGEQGESSGGNGGSDNLVKFDNNEPDHIYQEFAVEPNADYIIEIVTQFKPLTGGANPSMLELRVLAGSGYNAGYSPTYYSTSADYPKNGYGYTTIAQVETAANNLMTQVMSNPGDDSYLTNTFGFNAGANSSVALFVRGIGGAAGGSYGYNSGDEEIRMDYVKITAN